MTKNIHFIIFTKIRVANDSRKKKRKFNFLKVKIILLTHANEEPHDFSNKMCLEIATAW